MIWKPATALEIIVRRNRCWLKKVKAKHLKWIAVAHFNTDNPRSSCLAKRIHRRETGRTETLRITGKCFITNKPTKRRKHYTRGRANFWRKQTLRNRPRTQKRRKPVLFPKPKNQTEKQRPAEMPNKFTSPIKQSGSLSWTKSFSQRNARSGGNRRRTKHRKPWSNTATKTLQNQRRTETGTTRHVSLFLILSGKLKINSRRRRVS